MSEKNAAKIAGRNLLRVWKEVDKVSRRLQKTLDPLEDDLPDSIGGSVVDAESLGAASVAHDEI